MAKGKKNGSNSGGDNNNNNNNNGGNNNSNNKGDNNNNKGGGGEKGGGGGEGGDYLNIVLKVDRHCEGCTQRIRKCLLSFSGVHTVSFEGETTVKIVAKKNIDAVKVTEHLKKKLSKMAELISPKPPKKDDQKKDNNKAADDKKPKEKELPIATVILKIQCHCTGCCEKTYKALSSHKGVYEVNIDKEKDLVTVKGKVDGKQMVESINKKLKKPVEIVPEKKNQKDKKDGGDGEKKQENNSGGGGGAKGGEKVPYDAEGYRFQYAYGYGYGPIVVDRATHFFSDENATGCSIM